MENETKEKNLEQKICINHGSARKQRESHIANGVGKIGTGGYEQIGCFDCDGYRTSCPRYYIIDKDKDETIG